jgi:hypothetical protein
MAAQNPVLDVSGSNLDPTLPKLYQFSQFINGTRHWSSKIY